MDTSFYKKGKKVSSRNLSLFCERYAFLETSHKVRERGDHIGGHHPKSRLRGIWPPAKGGVVIKRGHPIFENFQKYSTPSCTSTLNDIFYKNHKDDISKIGII